MRSRFARAPHGARAPRRIGAALITAVVGLVGVVPAADAAVRVGQNYRLTSDPSPFRGKDQVGIAANPRNTNHIVASMANYLTENCEATASFDGGRTWTVGVPLIPPPATPAYQPSCRISNHLAESTYQTIAFGSGSTVYATTISPRFGSPTEQGAAVIVYKSTDGGRSWGAGVVSLPGGPTEAAGPYHELPTIAVDPGAGPGGADIVYSAAREIRGAGNSAGCPVASCPSVRLSTSLDGGQTFGPSVQASPPGVPIAGPDSASQPVVNPDGSVAVAWRTLGGTGLVQVARSTNRGATWSAPVDVAGVSNLSRTGTSHVTPNVSNGSTFPRLAGDRRNGNLYIVYNQGEPGPTAPTGGFRGADHFIPPDSKVYFQRSLDGGATWSRPKLINDDTRHPGVPIVQTRHPEVVVAPSGRVDVLWEDRRHWYQGPGERNCIHTHLACDDPRLGDTYYAYSEDRGGSFSRNIRITDHSHNNDVGYDYRFGTGWCCGPVAAPLGGDELLIAWMDSREGSFDTDTQDIYLARVDHNGPAAAAQRRVGEDDPVAMSVALSQFGYKGGGESVLTSTFATRNATRVVIVNSGDYAGAAAGSVLARAFLAPVLLSPAGGLPASVKAEIARLSPAGAFVVGDTSKLSAQVVADLGALGIAADKIDRVSGAGDAGTAAEMATRMDRRLPAERTAGAPAFDAVVIANPASADTAAATALAAARRLPILYVGATSVPAATTAALAALNINRTLVVGGTDDVSSAVAAGLPGARRLGGGDQYATSREVVDESVARGLPGNIVYAVDGERPMDAALTGAIVGRATGIMVLARAPLATNAAGAASAAGLRAVDQIVLVSPPPGTPPPAPLPRPTPPPAAAKGKAPAKLALARARIIRRTRQLDVLAPITRLASGKVDVELHAAGRRTRFQASINSRDGRIRFRRRIPAAQANLGTGILTIRYRGDADTRPQDVRLRAAAQRADLSLSRPTLRDGRVRASGTISRRARGVVRLQVQYVVGEETVTLRFHARIRNGRWSVNERLSQAVQDAIARRIGTVHSYTLFTGYMPARMRGEMRSFQILGDR